MFANFNLEKHVGHTHHSNGTKSNSVDDKTLWQRFKTGNDLAFSMIYKRYVQRLYNYGMHTCYNHELVVDSLQDLFGRLWTNRQNLADVESVSAYLFTAYRRLVINRVNQQRKFSLPITGKEERGFDKLASREDAIIDEETAVQQKRMLQQAISALSKRQREVIFLKFFNELTYQEIATVMEMSVDSVYNLMSKAIESLRVILQKHD